MLRCAPRSTLPPYATLFRSITVTNINTGMQGLSPMVIATHPASVHAWQLGQLASKGQELVAEEGMPDIADDDTSEIPAQMFVVCARLLARHRIALSKPPKDG